MWIYFFSPPLIQFHSLFISFSFRFFHRTMQFYSRFFHWIHFNQLCEVIYHFDFFFRIFNQISVHHFWFYQASFPLTYFYEMKWKLARDIIKWKILFPISFIIFFLNYSRVIVTSLLFIIRSTFLHSSFHLHFALFLVVTFRCIIAPEWQVLHREVRRGNGRKDKRARCQEHCSYDLSQFSKGYTLLFWLLIILYDWNLWFEQTEKIKILNFLLLHLCSASDSLNILVLVIFRRVSPFPIQFCRFMFYFRLSSFWMINYVLSLIWSDSNLWFVDWFVFLQARLQFSDLRRVMFDWWDGNSLVTLLEFQLGHQ